MPKAKPIKQIVNFSASPHEIYEMLMDSKLHEAFTGDTAQISRKVGGNIEAYGGWIEGKNLKLIPDRLIIQSWRGADWPEGVYSKAMFLLAKTKTGTKLTFGQTGVPASKYKDIDKGWETEYWGKMKKYLEEDKK